MKITFEVKKITHQTEDGFAIIRGKITEAENRYLRNSEQTLKGNFKMLLVGDIFESEVLEKKNSTFGKQYQIQGASKMVMPETENTIRGFIERRAKVVKGIGKKKIDAIMELHGMSAIDEIRKSPVALMKAGINEEKATKLQELINHKSTADFEEISSLFAMAGLSTTLVLEVTKQLVDINLQKIVENPYILTHCDKVRFKDADTIAKHLGKNPENPVRHRFAVVAYLINRKEGNGDICVKIVDILDELKAGAKDGFLYRNSAYQTAITINEENTGKALEALKKEKLISVDYSEAKEEHIYLTAFLAIENQIVKRVSEFNGLPNQQAFSSAIVNGFISGYEVKNFPLAKKQKEAIHMASSHMLSILTGGPGTGKTATTRAIVEAFQQENPKARIRLLAPTGKASKRLSELTGMRAETIHRALGIKGFGRDDEEITLTEDLIVVDESSMIDAQLFHKLLKNTADGSRILLVGDVNQLDSVGAGRILSDLIESDCVAVTKLDEVFRQSASSQIVSNAHKMIDGKGFKDTDGLQADSTKGDFYFVERKTEESIQEDILKTVERFINKGVHLNDIMVLSAMKRGDIGTEALNKAIQDKFNPPTDFADHKKYSGEILRIGDRVIHTENNPDLMVFNGEVGTVVQISEKERNGRAVQVIDVEFPDRKEAVEYMGLNIEQLTLAYAITIHKSQGSESKLVIMPVHKAQGIMLDRSLLYTGITRAKETVVLLGEKETFDKAVLKVNGSKRTSLIREKLQATA